MDVYILVVMNESDSLTGDQYEKLSSEFKIDVTFVQTSIDPNTHDDYN